MLKTYADFLAYADEAGVMVFAGKFIDGFPNLSVLTSQSRWHTGDPETDPWQFRDRATQERRLAFGSILGGHKGFISPKLYPLFYSACRPDGSMEERWRRGHVRKTVYDVYGLFEEGVPLDTAEIRKRMNVRKGDGASSVDGALVTLQKEFYITVCGSRRKMSFDGAEYGWPANTYCLTDGWASGWLKEPLLPTDEAREHILAHIAALDDGIDIKKAEKLLFGKCCAGNRNDGELCSPV